MDISSEVWQQITCRWDVQYFGSMFFQQNLSAQKKQKKNNNHKPPKTNKRSLWLMLRFIMSGCWQPSNCFLSQLKNKQTKQNNAAVTVSVTNSSLKSGSAVTGGGCRATRVDPAWGSGSELSVELHRETFPAKLNGWHIRTCSRRWLSRSSHNRQKKKTFPRRRNNPPILTWMSRAALVQAT